MYILSHKLDPVSPWKSRECPELSDAVKGIQDCRTRIKSDLRLIRRLALNISKNL